MFDFSKLNLLLNKYCLIANAGLLQYSEKMFNEISERIISIDYRLRKDRKVMHKTAF